MKLKLSLLFLLFFSMIAPSYGQMMDEESGITTEVGYRRYITVGAGAVYQSFYDDIISKYNYQKIGFAPSFGHIKMNENTFSDFYFQGSHLRFNRNNNSSNPLSLTSTRALMDYRFLVRPPLNFLGLDMRAGAVLSTMYGNKTVPHLLEGKDIHEYAISLGLGIRIAHNTYFKKKPGILSWDFGLPFITNFSRPSYLNRVEKLDPENVWWQDFLENSVTKSFSGYLRINSRLSYTYILDNGNAVRVGYRWDFTRINHKEVAYFAEHTVMLSFLLNH